MSVVCGAGVYVSVRSELEPEVDTVGIYAENHEGSRREFVISIQLGTLILWMREESKRNRPVIMKTNVCENEPRHGWRLVETSRIIRDDISHHDTS